MSYLNIKILLLAISVSFRLIADDISLDYQLMNRQMFESTVVSNTIIGITPNSHNLYMLYFLPKGLCELWIKDQVFSGKWWSETDLEGKDCVRAFWPEYTSPAPTSLFFPQSPKYGNATSVRYYINPKTKGIIIAGKKKLTHAVIASGNVFPDNKQPSK